MYEEKPDYSGRLALKRLIQILLDPENPQNPPADPAAYYGGTINQDHYFRNLSDDPYERFQQTTLTTSEPGRLPAALRLLQHHRGLAAGG